MVYWYLEYISYQWKWKMRRKYPETWPFVTFDEVFESWLESGWLYLENQGQVRPCEEP